MSVRGATTRDKTRVRDAKRRSVHAMPSPEMTIAQLITYAALLQIAGPQERAALWRAFGVEPETPCEFRLPTAMLTRIEQLAERSAPLN